VNYRFHVGFPLVTLGGYVLVMLGLLHIRGIHGKHFRLCYALTADQRSMGHQFQRMSADAGEDLGWAMS